MSVRLTLIGSGAIAVASDIGCILYLDSDGNIAVGHDPASNVISVCDGNGCDLNLNDEGDRAMIN